MIQRIALVTDFGPGGPYVGQMKLFLAELVPGIPVIDLVSDLPCYRTDLAAYLLPALSRDVPEETLFLCVVDPGVGGERGILAMEADGRWFLGPDNGILSLVARRADRLKVHRVTWRPERLSNSFHGRDLFCPLAAKLVRGGLPESEPLDMGAGLGADWPEDLAKVVYSDLYGNLVIGIRASVLDRKARLQIGSLEIAHARTFCEVPLGTAFWYENSFGLVELAVNQGNARNTLGLGPGDQIDLDIMFHAKQRRTRSDRLRR